MHTVSKKSISGLLSILALGGVLASGQAVACCAYNNTGEKIKFAWHLASDWHVSAHDHQCDNGKGGKMDVWIERSMASDTELCGGVAVDDHGWISVYQNENTFVVKSYASGGEVKQQCTKIIAGAQAGPKP